MTIKSIKIISVIYLLSLTNISQAQSHFKEYKNLFAPPLSYVTGHTTSAPIIDGDINDDAWMKAEWTSFFEDIEGTTKPKPYYKTRAKLLWDKTYLYIAAELEESHVWATLSQRDEIVFHDNDFEIFIDPTNTTHQYFEIEINALNNIFDLFLPKPYRNRGSALFSWNTPGMKHAVKINGTLNNPDDKDQAWTVEFAIPFSALTMGNHIHIPKDGDIWRINFSRVQWETEIIGKKYIKKKDSTGKPLPEYNWVWSPQGVIDMHRPERWGYLLFSEIEAGTNLPVFELPYSELQKQYLWLIYYKQNSFRSKNKHYATSLSELGLKDIVDITNITNKLTVHATKSQFTAIIKDVSGNTIRINEEGLIMK
ncbi:carbohydrate-binding family 9-like protein [Dysgonomonas sp. Marseille-P4677]|uniref:carbohydrate-binding family 9-like protein n=1 Tax=Dysgonomonas sp. Marseille-P4677 TaxID=2364790 RepID=UPI001911817A|nr:carbohydrate-binding family 9-like protein [Dysgonomonas sp. Marseille-P4677]MBK5720069.1 carbohydrate-binding family 9-like protein [Dysgonomonas sp. Marseille-P4677]